MTNADRASHLGDICISCQLRSFIEGDAHNSATSITSQVFPKLCWCLYQILHEMSTLQILQRFIGSGSGW